ncbi:Stellacyanin [Morella rubra]|uniref:Stellacyanin n=1 Tax=Morella rubra TaxID=262757 RepID=A0A6A1UFU2_9ROSI|nr:Stellacyanin [Morella rubra]KAB1221001.1 Stellacyanin [Morella rubra]
MAKTLNMCLLALIAVAAVLQTSMATTYTVGDTSGWTVPPSGAGAYSTWAANKSFTVGDILVFTFTTGAHDVARVTKAAYDVCNLTSPISIETNGPANLTLNDAGEHYYICTIASHCTLGQKLAINVTAATSPTASPPAATPSPSTPSPTGAAAPPPTTATPPSSTTTPSTPSPTGSASPPPPTATPPSSTTTPSTPSPTGSASPPPPPSSATSLGVTGLGATFLSIVIAFLY